MTLDSRLRSRVIPIVDFPSKTGGCYLALRRRTHCVMEHRFGWAFTLSSTTNNFGGSVWTAFGLLSLLRAPVHCYAGGVLYRGRL